METIGLSSPLPSVLHAGRAAPEVGIAMSKNAHPGKADFLATLLAMAGHDLRQPLQMITSAHDVLGRIVHNDEQREELAQAGAATRRLADMLGQLVEALERTSDRAITYISRHGCIPFSTTLPRSSPTRHGRKGSRCA